MTERTPARAVANEPGTIILSEEAINVSPSFKAYFKGCEAKVSFYFVHEMGLRAGLELMRAGETIQAVPIPGARGLNDWQQLPGVDATFVKLSFSEVVDLHERAQDMGSERVRHGLDSILADRIAQLVALQPDTKLWITPPNDGAGPLKLDFRSLGTALQVCFEIPGVDAMEFFGMNTL